jgi:hypothetical protein
MTGLSKNGRLRALVLERDNRGLNKLLHDESSLAEAEIEAIVQVLAEVEFGRFTLTPCWWSLAEKLLPLSRTLREHMFAILGGTHTPTVEDAYRKTDRSNILHAIAPLNLSATKSRSSAGCAKELTHQSTVRMWMPFFSST